MSPDSPNRILVVDDEERIRTAVRRVLESMGMEVFDAANGREGLEAIAAHRPDLVLVDLMMPVMDGMEMIGQARRQHATLAFVVITGYATLEKAVEAMKQGADDFLAKPFKPQELRLVIERVLKRVATLQDMAIERSRTRVLIEAMSNGVLVVDDQARIVLMNSALAKLAKYSGEAYGLDLSEVIDCVDVAEAMGQVLSGKAADGQVIQCTMKGDTPGEPVHLQVRCGPFRDIRGNTVGALAVFDDITPIQRLDELKSEYVSTVAHEIASPLSSVLSQLQNLAQGLAGGLNERQAHIVERARGRIQGIINLSKDLLDLSKIEAGVMGDPDEQLDLAAILEESVDIIRPAAEQKDQTLTVNISGGLPHIKAVAREIQEVFVNLLSNAVRYSPSGGAIELSAIADDNEAVVRVKDNGFGIPADEQDKIFERFYRIKDANTREIVGTGLGLPIVKRVVEASGGRLELNSRPGKGSTFTVRLPGSN